VFIFFFIFFHAPISVWLSSIWPEQKLIIKAWKEILILLSAIILFIILLMKGKISYIYYDKLVVCLIAYIVLHILLITIFGGSVQQIIAGLMIDLRYIALFGVVYLAVKFIPTLKKNILTTVSIAGSISLIFALLQLSVLPKDILASIGYNKDTIQPYLTVDRNHDFIRINGTLRGPNPLGALAATGFVFVLVYTLMKHRNRSIQKIIAAGILFCLSLVVWFSYSRSALGAVFISVTSAVILWHGSKMPKKFWLIGSSIILAMISSLFFFRDTSFVQNTIFHNNPKDSNQINSDDAHVTSLGDGYQRMLDQPFGAGIGSTGSASYLSDQPLVIENQYLFIAHESGWLGLALFGAIISIIYRRLYKVRRHDWLAMAVLSSGVGLFAIGLVLPVFVDDTVSLVWWGLAGVALGFQEKITKKNRQS
jgi:hypothetical protein